MAGRRCCAPIVDNVTKPDKFERGADDCSSAPSIFGFSLLNYLPRAAVLREPCIEVRASTRAECSEEHLRQVRAPFRQQRE